MSLGNLVVSLMANTAQFTGAMDKAAYTSAKRMAEMKVTANNAGKAIGAAISTWATGASVLVKQSIDSADAMSKMAQKAGVSVESLSSLSHAAALSDVDVGSLQSAMVKLSKGMSDASMGTGEALKGFDALGISVKDSEGNLKSSDVMMSEVAAKFATMEDGANKTALAVAIFGRSGADLIPMLNSGSAGLKEMQEEARALGVELDGKTAQSAERFNDNLTRLNTVKKGFANQIMKAMLPALEGVTNSLVNAAKASGGMDTAVRMAATGIRLLLTGGALITATFKAVGQYLGGVAAQVVAFFSGNFRQAIEIGKATNADFMATLKGAANTVSTIWDESAAKVEAKAPATGAKIAAPMMTAAKKAGQAREKIVKEVKETVDAVQNMLASLSSEGITSGKNEEQMSRYRLLIAGATKDQIEHHDVLWEIINAKREEQKVTEEGARLMEETRTPLEQYATRIARLNELIHDGAIKWEVYDRAVKMAQDNLDKTTKVGEDSMAELQKSVEGWGKQFTDTFVDGVMKGKMSFKDLANSIISDILRIIVQKQVLNAIGGFGESGSGGTGMIGMAMSLFGGGKASGGPVKPGTSYLVGERGPETFTPSTPGTITPSASGAPVTVIQNFTVGDVASISMVRQAVAGSERRIAAGIGRSMSYGGALS